MLYLALAALAVERGLLVGVKLVMGFPLTKRRAYDGKHRAP